MSEKNLIIVSQLKDIYKKKRGRKISIWHYDENISDNNVEIMLNHEGPDS